jgi:hypothetical protein
VGRDVSLRCGEEGLPLGSLADDRKEKTQMQRWNKAILIAMVTGLLLGAVPAQAEQVPFSFVVPITRGFETGVDASDRGSGFVGGCDVDLECVGASVRVANTEGAVEVGGATLALVGSLCLQDEAAPCGSAGDPGTGFVLTRRELVMGGSRAEIPDFEVEFCVWQQAPRDLPTECQTYPVDARLLTVSTGTAQLGDQIPERVVIGITRT